MEVEPREKNHTTQPGKLLSRSIALVLLFLFPSMQFHAQSAVKTAAPAAVETQVRAIGIGHKAIVKRNDGSQLKGTIVAIDESTFSLNQGKHKGNSLLAFSDVSTVRKASLSTGAKVGIGVGIGVGITAAVIAISLAISCHGSAYCDGY